MTLSDLAKYSVTRSVAPSLFDSWASCSCSSLSWSSRHNCLHTLLSYGM